MSISSYLNGASEVICIVRYTTAMIFPQSQHFLTPASCAHFSVCVLESAKKRSCSMSRSHYNHTPLTVKPRYCSGCHVSIVDKVGCYGRETLQSVNHFKIFHTSKGSTKQKESRPGMEIRTV